MTVNNFDKMGFLDLPKEKGDQYAVVIIIKRKKDNPHLERNSITIGSYCIRTENDLQKKKIRIMNLCDEENARAYIYVNKRSFKKTHVAMIKTLCDYLDGDNSHKAESCFWDTSNRNPAESKDNKKWVIDIDDSSMEEVNRVIEEVKKVSTYPTPVYSIINTKNGFHLITAPFNTHLCDEVIKKHEIFKDNFTPLYIK